MPLTDKAIKGFKPLEKKKRYFDGGGLYLEVTPAGGKLWRLKFRFQGKEKLLALGVYPDVSLKEARLKAQDARKMLSEGIDPSKYKNIRRTENERTFEAVAREWYEQQKVVLTEGTWQNNLSRMQRLVFPEIGNMPIKEVMPPDILRLCRRIESSGITYTAHAVLGLCSRAFQYAVACGYADSDPCRDLRGALRPHRTRKTPAFTNPADVRRLLLAIDSYTGHFSTCYALRLLPLLFVRQGELRNAEWQEFDLVNAIWRIPAGRMKMREEHLVPLSQQSLQILHELYALTGSGRLLLPSPRSRQRPLSENTINAALTYMGIGKEEMLGHGFRAMASTLLNEMGWSPDVIEKQLAHAERNTVRAAYNRAMYLDERRKMMQAWGDYLDSLRVAATMPLI
jgi:integrase